MKGFLPLLFLPFIYGQAGEKPSSLNLTWVAQNSGVSVSIRGLKAVDKQTAWLCGSGGVVARTTDGGESWTLLKGPWPKNLDFRDVAAFDSKTAWIMSSASGEDARIYKTTDGGGSWQRVFKMKHPKGFLNTLYFANARKGFAVSDPIDDRLFLLTTANGGDNWQRIPPDLLPPLQEGEYLFAASGTCIAGLGDKRLWVGTGGSTARIFRWEKEAGWTVHETPMVSGSPSQGIFSVAFLDAKRGIAAGGDYTREKQGGSGVIWTEDGGRTWRKPHKKEAITFRSCVDWLSFEQQTVALAVGPAGSGYSLDYGKSWRSMPGNFHVLSVGDGPDAVWAAGADGRVGKLVFQRP